MPEKLQAAIAAWKEADERAHAAERLLAKAWQMYFAGEGPAVSEELINEVAQLRSEADRLLQASIAAIRPPPVPERH